MQPLVAGLVVLADFGATIGAEQSGIRPAVVIASDDFVDVIDRMTIVVPCSRTDRSWRNHVELRGETGLQQVTFAMTEQVRSIAVQRVLRVMGVVDDSTLESISRWVSVWIDPAA